MPHQRSKRCHLFAVVTSLLFSFLLLRAKVHGHIPLHLANVVIMALNNPQSIPRNDRHSVGHRTASTVGRGPPQYDDRDKRFSTTFLIVLVSLLFVAVFGGALVGGVVTGDPSNGFFITIIAASGVAIGVAACVSLRYCYQQRTASAQRDFAMKENRTEEIHGTFTRSVDDDEEAGYYDNRGQYYPNREPVQERIPEVTAPIMAPTDISAMSPTTYDLESYGQTASQFSRSEYNGNGYRPRINQKQIVEERRGPFDFSSVSTPCRNGIPMRLDPPEDNIGCNLYCGLPLSKDPSAAIAAADGSFVHDEDSDVDPVSPARSHSTRSVSPARSQSSRSQRSRYDVDDEEETSDRNSEVMTDASRGMKRDRSKSPRNDRKAMNDLVAPPPPPPPPRSTRSSNSGHNSQSSKTVPGTPTASETGSTVSSLFLKPFAAMFGGKRTTSEAGYSDAGSNVKGSEVRSNRRVKPEGSDSDNIPSSGNEGRPPKPGKKNSEKRTGLSTIGGYPQSTIGKNSAFIVPPPRHVPSTPGSEAPSEFRSMAGSSVFSNGVASSTFDPGARDRAVRRTQRNTNALGANFNDMPIYYDEDESAIQSAAPSVQSATPSIPTAHSVGYDVFAPPGPIGMVVDTIDKGCVVHSLKKTSPMQGLINPGDLIVALDDVDVRNLDAAELTKLMAKKSQQKERKFTLIPADQL